jgi:ATP diphosphatase
VSALDGVEQNQPALLRADAISRRAAATGFDWDDATGARAKVVEEMAEVDAADSPAERTDEIGDLLFALVNWARKLGIEPEAALHQATTKFERRFRAMEDDAGDAFPTLSLDQMEQLWQQVKRSAG